MLGDVVNQGRFVFHSAGAGDGPVLPRDAGAKLQNAAVDGRAASVGVGTRDRQDARPSGDNRHRPAENPADRAGFGGVERHGKRGMGGKTAGKVNGAGQTDWRRLIFAVPVGARPVDRAGPRVRGKSAWTEPFARVANGDVEIDRSIDGAGVKYEVLRGRGVVLPNIARQRNRGAGGGGGEHNQSWPYQSSGPRSCSMPLALGDRGFRGDVALAAARSDVA